MHSTSVFSYIMTMISNFHIFHVSNNYFQVFLYKYNRFFHFLWFLQFFLNNFTFLFLKLIIFIASSLKDSQNFFIKSFPLHISCLFSMLLNDDIVAIKKPDRRCSHISVVDEFSGFYLHPSIYFIKHSRST